MSYNNYAYTRPIEVRGGIRAGSKRGALGSSWWAKRWLQTLEEFRIGTRLDRGRSYARRGQVMSVDVQPGGVTARVQGSRKRPYRREHRGPDHQSAGLGTPPGGHGGTAHNRRQPAVGPHAGQHRGVLPDRRPIHVPGPAGRPGDGLLVSRLVQPMQARRRRVSAAGRGVRPGPLPDLPDAGHGPGGPAGPGVPPLRPDPGGARTARRAPAAGTRGVLVQPADGAAGKRTIPARPSYPNWLPPCPSSWAGSHSGGATGNYSRPCRTSTAPPHNGQPGSPWGRRNRRTTQRRSARRNRHGPPPRGRT